MKQGTKFALTVDVGINLDDVEKIIFKFSQGNENIKFNYPADETTSRVENTNSITLVWSIENTYKFNTKIPVEMDTFISMIGSDLNPDTEIKKFILDRTLFTKEELNDD